MSKRKKISSDTDTDTDTGTGTGGRDPFKRNRSSRAVVIDNDTGTTDTDTGTSTGGGGTGGRNPFKRYRDSTAIDVDITLPSTKRSRGNGSILIAETKAMERNRRLVEQQGERKLASVKARDHSNEEQVQQSPEGELQNNILQHPELASQRFDGVDPNLNPEPPLNTEARREFDNEKREQDKEKQLRLGNMPTHRTDPTPRGP